MNRLFGNLSTVSELLIDKIFPFEFEYFSDSPYPETRNRMRILRDALRHIYIFQYSIIK